MALGEPAVHRGEQVARSVALALVAQQPGPAHRGAQLVRPRALPAGQFECRAERGLGPGLVPPPAQELTLQPMQLGLVKAVE